MRSAILLLGGFVLLALGITDMALEVPGRWITGPVLVVVGIALKLAGLLRDPQPRAAEGGRTKTTLGTAAAPAASGQPAVAPARAVTSRATRRRQTGQVS